MASNEPQPTLDELPLEIAQDPALTLMPAPANTDWPSDPWWLRLYHAAGRLGQQGVQAQANFLQGKKPSGEPAETPYDRADALAQWFASSMGPNTPAALATPAGSLGMFAGRVGMAGAAKAGNFTPTRMLPIAQAYDKAGMNADLIWARTGFYKAQDGKWRWEIPDQGARFTGQEARDIIAKHLVDNNAVLPLPNGQTIKITPANAKLVLDTTGFDAPMAAILDHPELYKAYPELAEYPVRIAAPGALPDGVLGQHVQGQGIILHWSLLNDPAKALSTILHEGQHGVQSIEGFARGGNPVEWSSTRYLQSPALQQEYQKSLTNVMDRAGVPPLQRPRLGAALVHPATREAIQNDLYARMHGEVEARAVQQRALEPRDVTAGMSPAWQYAGEAPHLQVGDPRFPAIGPGGPLVRGKGGSLHLLVPVEHNPFEGAQ